MLALLICSDAADEVESDSEAVWKCGGLVSLKGLVYGDIRLQIRRGRNHGSIDLISLLGLTHSFR